MSDLSFTAVKSFILNLANQHGVTYTQTSNDRLAYIITQLSDDKVEMDYIELLLIALERDGVIDSQEVLPLHVKYLREKLHV